MGNLGMQKNTFGQIYTEAILNHTWKNVEDPMI